MKETSSEPCRYAGHERRPSVYRTTKTVKSTKLQCEVTYANETEICLTCLSIKRKIKRGTYVAPYYG